MDDFLGFRSSKINPRIESQRNLSENRQMRIIAHSVIFAYLLMTAGQLFAGQPARADDGNASLEFSVKKDQGEDRVADFYTRLILLERESQRREQGAEEKREARKRQVAIEEKARKEFKREKSVDNPQGEKEHERELAERAKEHELARKDYVRRRDEMNRNQKKAGTIPEDVEYGINQDPGY
jgi:hypothetical protein